MSFDYFVSIKCGNVTNAQLQLWNHVPHMRCFYELFWQDGRTLMAVHTLDPDTTFVPSSCLHPLSLRTKLEPTDYPRTDAVFDTNCFADKMRVVDVLKHCGSFVRIFLYEVLCMDVYICSDALRELMSPLVTFHGEQQLLHMLTLLRNHLYSKVWVHSDLQVHSLHHLGTTDMYFNDRTCVFQKWQSGPGVLRVKPGRVVTSTSMVSLMQTLLQNTQAPCLVIIQHYLMGQWRHMLTTCFPHLGALFLSDASSFHTVCVESYQTCDLVLCTDKYLQVEGVTDRLRVSELNRCCRPTDTQVPLNFWRWKQLVHTCQVRPLRLQCDSEWLYCSSRDFQAVTMQQQGDGSLALCGGDTPLPLSTERRAVNSLLLPVGPQRQPVYQVHPLWVDMCDHSKEWLEVCHPVLSLDKEFRLGCGDIRAVRYGRWPVVSLDQVHSYAETFYSKQNDANLMSQFAYFERTVQDMQPAATMTQRCSICFDAEANCIVACGHLYCGLCVMRISVDSGRCARCRFPVNKVSVFRLLGREDTSTSLQTGKVKVLSQFLSGVKPHAQVVVVVQWLSVIHNIKSDLVTERKVLVFAGNTKTCESVYRETLQGDPYVLLVPFHNIHGLVLHNIAHVVLFHMPGSPSFVDTFSTMQQIQAAPASSAAADTQFHVIINRDTQEEKCYHEMLSMLQVA